MTDYFSVLYLFFFSCALVRVFHQKSCALWQKEEEEKEEKNCAEQQNVHAPFVVDILLLALARREEASAVRPDVESLHLLHNLEVSRSHPPLLPT